MQIFGHFPAFSVIICKCEEGIALRRFHALHGDTFLPSAQMLRSEGRTGPNLFHGSSDAAHRAVTKHSLGSSALAEAAAIGVNTSFGVCFFSAKLSLGVSFTHRFKKSLSAAAVFRFKGGWRAEIKLQVTPAASSGSAASVKSSCRFRHVEVTSR